MDGPICETSLTINVLTNLKFAFIVFLHAMILKEIKTDQDFFLFLDLNIGLKSCQSNEVDMTQ